MSKSNWKSSPFESVEEWKKQCKKSPAINDGDFLSFKSIDVGGYGSPTVVCYIKEDKNGTELFVTVGYFFPNGDSVENIQPNCGWSH
jgi:hypothetical protein